VTPFRWEVWLQPTLGGGPSRAHRPWRAEAAHRSKPGAASGVVLRAAQRLRAAAFFVAFLAVAFLAVAFFAVDFFTATFLATTFFRP
jgi:hypothetical protein